MVDVTTTIIISVPKEKVSAYAANPDNAPQWYKNIKSVEWKTQKQLVSGSQIAFKAKFLGKELSYTYEITQFIPVEKLVMRTAEGPFPMETTYQWLAIDNDSTLMTLRNMWQPSGFSKLFAPFMALAMKRANKKDLALIRSILEKNN